jgi:hypothetical protein
MKTHMLLLCFLWASCDLSIAQAQPKPDGHWPVPAVVSHLAVMPKISKGLISSDGSMSNDDLEGLALDFDPARELGLVVTAGLVGLTPAFLCLDFWW